MTPEQIAQTRRAIEEEYRLNLEALESFIRIERFIPTSNGIGPKPSMTPVESAPLFGEEAGVRNYPKDSLIGMIASAMKADSQRTWTSSQMAEHLESVGYKLKAKVPSISIGSTMQVKLLRRDEKIELVTQGSGRIPNQYRWKQV